MSEMDVVMTPIFRVSFPYVHQPQQTDSGEKYSVQMIFDEDADLKPIYEMIDRAIKKKFPDGKTPANFRSDPFRDGDEKINNRTGQVSDGYAGKIFATAGTKMKPGIKQYNPDGPNPDIIDQNEFYGGCYAVATLNAYTYNVKGNSGVALGLQHVMKVKEGEPFTGRTTADEDFQSVEIDLDGAGDASVEDMLA